MSAPDSSVPDTNSAAPTAGASSDDALRAPSPNPSPFAGAPSATPAEGAPAPSADAGGDAPVAPKPGPGTRAPSPKVEASGAGGEEEELGNEAFESGRFEASISHYSEALKLINRSPDLSEAKATILCNRSAAFASMSMVYRSRPASRSEFSALYGLDPTHLAQLALADASKALELRPDWPKAYSRKGMAQVLLEKYLEAEETYLAGLALDPAHPGLQEGLKQVADVLSKSKAAAKRLRSLDREVDELECILCMRLLFEPVTTPCGHSFCSNCFMRATDHAGKCPMCRTVLHCGRKLPVTLTLANIISRSFPQEYEERRAEEEASLKQSTDLAEGPDGLMTLPLFVMSSILPGEAMALNIFEPRYRLMVRRAMEGNRRFGMAQCGRGRALEDCLVEAEIIECNPLPDGRYHLDIVGRRRMKLVSSSDLDGYRLAAVKLLRDEPEAEGTEPPLAQLGAEVSSVVDRTLAQVQSLGGNGNPLRELMRRLGPRPVVPTEPGPSQEQQLELLSFWIATLVLNVSPGLSDGVRMDLIKMTSTRARLVWLRTHLSSALGEGGRCSIM